MICHFTTMHRGLKISDTSEGTKFTSIVVIFSLLELLLIAFTQIFGLNSRVTGYDSLWIIRRERMQTFTWSLVQNEKNLKRLQIDKTGL